MEKVIFRSEYDKENKRINYLAVFPDDPANPGMFAYVPFFFGGEKQFSGAMERCLKIIIIRKLS